LKFLKKNLVLSKESRKQATYFGGENHDCCSSLTIDGNSHIFISGSTASPNFPVTPGAYDRIYNPGGNWGDDAFVAKFDNNLNALLSSTFIGGLSDDFSEALANDQDGNIYIAGWTSSADYPTSNDAYDRTYGAGFYDAFVSKFDNELTNLLGSTYLGGSNWDFSYSMCLDQNGNVYTSGHTASTNYPTSENAYCRGYQGTGGAGTGDDLFVSKLNSSLTSLLASTYLGGSGWEIGYSMIADKQNNVLIVGSTSSQNFPTLEISYDRTYGGGATTAGDGFIAKLDSSLQHLKGSTFLGGIGDDTIGSIALDQSGNILVAGSSNSYDFPTTPTAYDTSLSGSFDAFVTKINTFLSVTPALPDFHGQPQTGHAPLFVEFFDHSQGDPPITSWEWDFDNDGVIDSQDQHPQWTYENPGIYDIRLIVSSNAYSDTLIRYEYVHAFDGNSSLSFDGQNSYGVLAPTPEINLRGSFTIEAWISPNSWGERSGVGYGRIIDKTSVSLYLLETHPSYNNHSLFLKMIHDDGSTSRVTSPENSIVLNEWQHVAVSYDADSTVNMYINGIKQEVTYRTTPVDSLEDNGDDGLFIGNSPQYSDTFGGLIDELRIWNVVRHEQQILDNINRYLNGDEPGLVSYFPMDEGNGDTIFDKSVNGQEGDVFQTLWREGRELNPPTTVKNYSSQKPLPEIFVLCDNYPNPFNPKTKIQFNLPNSTYLKLSILNISGQLVTTLLDNSVNAGYHIVEWDGFDYWGKPVSTGVYFYKLEFGNTAIVKKMLLLR